MAKPRGLGDPDTGQYNYCSFVPWLPTTFLLAKREVCLSIGGFDENYTGSQMELLKRKPLLGYPKGAFFEIGPSFLQYRVLILSDLKNRYTIPFDMILGKNLSLTCFWDIWPVY